MNKILNYLYKGILDVKVKSFWLILTFVLAFSIGFLIPSPIFRTSNILGVVKEQEELSDTIGMVLSNGSVYDGSIKAGTNIRQGYGRMVTANGSIYEGSWNDNKLSYGTRSTRISLYEGRFDENLCNNGFGIITYSKSYIDGKRKQGLSDNEIIQKYIGNWKHDLKEGLGRTINADGSMSFGEYKQGTLIQSNGAKYRIGGQVYGIDVSHHQGNIDWNNLALFCNENGDVFRGVPQSRDYMQPVFFAYVKATEGATYIDPTFSVRMIEAERHGLAKGAYHFMRLGSDVTAQIKNFVSNANWSVGDMPPALDIEDRKEIDEFGQDLLRSHVFSWLKGVEEQMHVRPIIYTTEYIRDNYLKKDSRFDKYQCWISRYRDEGPENRDWQIWQFTETGRTNGYKGAIDINLFKGDYHAFENYLNNISIN